MAKKNKWIAALLSAIVAGAGQIYNGEGKKGVVLLILAILIGVALRFLPESLLWQILEIPVLGAVVGIATTFGVIILWVYAIVDAWNTAKKIEKEGEL